MSSATTRKAAALAALDLAEDLNGGKVSVANLEAELVDAARNLFGIVVGPSDPLWPLQVDVARQAIHQGGIGLDELREWVAVLERRAGGAETPAEAPEPPGPPRSTGRHLIGRQRGAQPRQSPQEDGAPQ